MARAVVTSKSAPYPQHEPFYDVDPRTGASVEVFFADHWLAKSFGTRAGWFWWACQCGCLPEEPPTGPFLNSYLAYRDFLTRTFFE
ncbi:MAG TPA: hypothetical protein VN362_14105 [Xanthobacteraceae bacterium]|jgi:hypothetical protein|nr:hypothetical protein [Xanthobacteraceae bacterium]